MYLLAFKTCKLLDLFSLSEYSLTLLKINESRGTYRLKDNKMYCSCLDSVSDELTDTTFMGQLGKFEQLLAI